MVWSFPIGRILGSELRIHATFVLLLLWIGVSAWLTQGAASAIASVAFIAAIFACVVAHEFGHALTARRYGIATPDITLLPIGGLARLERMPENPREEVIVALAGPAVNVVIWAVLVFVFGATTDLDQLARLEDPSQGFLGRLAVVNLFLVLFNLLPAFPMDGGRVFRALLATRMSRVKATEIAATTGQIMAFVLGFIGLTGGNPLLILIAAFVYFAAMAENSDVSMRAVARGLQARDAMITEFESLGPTDTFDTAANTLIRTTQHEFPILDQDAMLLGFLTRQALFQAIAENARQRPVAEAMQRDIPQVPLTTRLDKTLEQLQQAGAPAVGVTGAQGQFLGYITPENLGELMLLRRQSRV